MFSKRLQDITVGDLFMLGYARSICRGAFALAAILAIVIAVQVVTLTRLHTHEQGLRDQMVAHGFMPTTLPVATDPSAR